MIAEIKLAYDAATSALKLAKSIQALSKDGEVNKVVIELQQSILNLQATIFDTQAKMEELNRLKNEAEEKLRNRDEWQKEKERYHLFEIAPGIVVYALKPDDKSGEPRHYLCPSCFQVNKKQFLQRPSPHHTNYKCNACNLEIRTDSGIHAESIRTGRRDRFSGL